MLYALSFKSDFKVLFLLQNIKTRMMMWQIILVVILVVPLSAGNILVRPLDGRKKPRNVRILNQAGTPSKTAEGGCCVI